MEFEWLMNSGELGKWRNCNDGGRESGFLLPKLAEMEVLPEFIKCFDCF
jgi:hypothetical protein